MDDVKQLTTAIIKGIVSNPDSVDVLVEKESDEKGDITLLLFKVHIDDIGLILGSQGETARAIRKVVSLYGYRTINERVYMKIVTPKMRAQYPQFAD